MKKLLIASILLFVVLSLSVSQENKKLKIAVIPKGNVQTYWKYVKFGTRLGAVASSKVEILWKAPEENNKVNQIDLVEECIKDNVDGIAIAPLDNVELVAPIAKATKANIPVIIFDSPLKGEAGKDFISLVTTNNKKAGFIAGEHLCKLMYKKGNVVLFQYDISQASIKDRTEGFLEAVEANKNIKVIAKKSFVGGSIEEAKKAALEIANELKKADGIFCPNESSTTGMLFALKSLNLAGKIKFVGFDTSEELIKAINNGDINALTAQNPSSMGFFSVKTLVDYIRGKKVDTFIDTGVELITKENIKEEKIQKLLTLPSLTD